MTGESRETASILVIDDDPALRNVMRVHLLKAGFAPELAANAKDGIEAFAGTEFDLVICDLCLPDANGVDLIAGIKKAWPDISVIATSGFINDEVIRSAMDAGAVDYLKKPFLKQTLLDMVQKALLCAVKAI